MSCCYSRRALAFIGVLMPMLLSLIFVCAVGGALAADCLKVDPQSVLPEVGKIREPLPYRLVSFHLGRADKDLIRRAAELGFNGVQFQLEGSIIKSLTDFKELNDKENYIDFCHDLGMDVTIWIHELSDFPGKGKPGYMGEVTLDNEKIWAHLEERYEWLLGEYLPDIDGLVLTVVETQINATDTDLMVKLVDLIKQKCDKYGKYLVVRTFVWHPKELEGVMGCVKQLPDDVIVMSKCVPQDWQMRGVHNKAIGEVGDRTQWVEYDVAGEYFLLDHVANCMPELLKNQFDYGLEKNVDGICVRVDRWDAQVLHQPSEVNLWALGMFATGMTDSVEDVWNAWATARYGREAAPGVIEALKPTQRVVTELLNIGSFSFGDNRYFPPPNGDRDALHTNWANFRWDANYIPEYVKGRDGDPLYTRKIINDKAEAMMLAEKSLAALEDVKGKLDPIEYEILYTKLLTNKVQLEVRAPMMIAWLKYRRVINIDNKATQQRLASEIRAQLDIIRSLANRKYPPLREVNYCGELWKLGAPLDFNPDRIHAWADKMEDLLIEKGL